MGPYTAELEERKQLHFFLWDRVTFTECDGGS
jgi:hypothetical protein